MFGYEVNLHLEDINSSNYNRITPSKLVKGVFDNALEFNGIDDFVKTVEISNCSPNDLMFLVFPNESIQFKTSVRHVKNIKEFI